MGSSKYQISVSSVAMHIIDVPDNPMLAMAKAAVLSGTDMLSTIFAFSSAGNLNNKMDTAFDYAENVYELALPGGVATQLVEPSKTTIATAIATDINHFTGVVVLNNKYTTYQPYHEVLDHLILNRKFDPITNQIYIWSGLDFSGTYAMYLTDSFISTDGLSVVINYEYWGHVYVESIGYDDVLLIPYYYMVPEWAKLSVHTETIPRIVITNTTYEDECLVAKYTKTDINGNELAGTYYWVYRIKDNTYPLLDNRVVTQQTSKYFPVVPIRANNIDLTAESLSETNLHVTSKELLRLLSIPFEYLGEQINANPDVAQIDNAYVMFGADLQSDEPATLAYLNHYFDYLQSLNTSAYSIQPPSINGNYQELNFTEHGLVLHMSHGGITTTYLPGRIGTGDINNARKSIVLTDVPAVYGPAINYGEGGDIVNLISDGYTSTNLILDLQVTSTTIRRVEVKDLMVSNYISGNNLVFTTLDMIVNDPDNHNCIIPLERYTALMLPAAKRALLYADCALLVITCYERTKLKWYQQSWFVPVVMIVMIVILVVSIIFLQPEIGLWVDGAIAAATISTEALIIYVSLAVVKVTLYAMAINYAAKLFIKLVGVEIGIIVAVIAAAATAAMGQFDTTAQLMAQYVMVTPQLLITISAAIVDAAEAAIQTAIADMTNDYVAFTNLLEKATEDLKANTEIQALSFADDLDPFAVLRRKTGRSAISGETPSMFFNRTLNLADNSYYTVHNAIPDFATNLTTSNIYQSMHM